MVWKTLQIKYMWIITAIHNVIMWIISIEMLYAGESEMSAPFWHSPMVPCINSAVLNTEGIIWVYFLHRTMYKNIEQPLKCSIWSEKTLLINVYQQ